MSPTWNIDLHSTFGDDDTVDAGNKTNISDIGDSNNANNRADIRDIGDSDIANNRANFRDIGDSNANNRANISDNEKVNIAKSDKIDDSGESKNDVNDKDSTGDVEKAGKVCPLCNRVSFVTIVKIIK